MELIKSVKIIPWNKWLSAIITALIGVGIFIVLLINFKLAILITVVILAFLLAIKFTEPSFYLAVLLFPFINWQFIHGSINAPWGDLAAMLVFAAWFFKAIFYRYFKTKKLSWRSFPGLSIFILFILAAGLSLINAEDVLFSLKYLARPLIFFYLMYVVLPYNIIDSRRKSRRVWQIFFGLGILISLMGLWSLIFPPTSFSWWRRAVPIAIGGIYPLGYNHNLLAEILVATIPAAIYLVFSTSHRFNRRLMALGLFLMIAINLATFSRAGWLGLLAEILIFVWCLYRKYFLKVFGYSIVIFTMMLPAIAAMYLFNTTSVASDSNSSRLMMTEIAIANWRQHPWIGNGVGGFENLVWQDRPFILEYGSALDAHGFVQKLLAEAGIFGLAAFVLFLGYLLYRILKVYGRVNNPDDRRLVAAMLMMAAGLIFVELFQTSYFIAKLWLPLGVALAAANLLEREPLHNKIFINYD